MGIINEVANELKKYTVGKKNTEKVEVSVLALNRLIFALEEQEPCSNCCNGNQIEKAKLCQKSYLAGMEHKQEPKTGHWTRAIDKTGHLVWECDKCGWQQRFHTNYCPDCGIKMVEPQGSEVQV